MSEEDYASAKTHYLFMQGDQHHLLENPHVIDVVENPLENKDQTPPKMNDQSIITALDQQIEN